MMNEREHAPFDALFERVAAVHGTDAGEVRETLIQMLDEVWAAPSDECGDVGGIDTTFPAVLRYRVKPPAPEVLIACLVRHLMEQ